MGNGIRQERERIGWSQAELAARARIPRPTLSAIETGRIVPSVRIALALARALGTTVETIFSDSRRENVWLTPPRSPQTPCRIHAAEVNRRVVLLADEALSFGPARADTVASARSPELDARLCSKTLLLATCDPLVPVLGELLAERGVRLLAVNRPSLAALDLLGRGLVHAAGLHFAVAGHEEQNRTRARAVLGEMEARILPCATWSMGLVVGREHARTSVSSLLRKDLKWVNRPEGSSARVALDRLVESYRAKSRRLPGYGRVCLDHRSVVDAVASGLAQAGISLRCTAMERGVDFIPLEESVYEIAVPQEQLEDPRFVALREVLESKAFTNELAAFPGVRPSAMDRASHVP